MLEYWSIGKTHFFNPLLLYSITPFFHIFSILLHQFNIVWHPRLVVERVKWSVVADVDEETLTRQGLDPVLSRNTFRLVVREVDVDGTICIGLRGGCLLAADAWVWLALDLTAGPRIVHGDRPEQRNRYFGQDIQLVGLIAIQWPTLTVFVGRLVSRALTFGHLRRHGGRNAIGCKVERGACAEIYVVVLIEGRVIGDIGTLPLTAWIDLGVFVAAVKSDNA